MNQTVQAKLLSKEAAENYEADGFGKTKSAEGNLLIKVWIDVRQDKQIPEFDAIDNLHWYFELLSNESLSEEELQEEADKYQKYTVIVFKMALEYGGMFIEDILKLSDRDIFSLSEATLHPQDYFPIPALRALKKAIYNYLENTGQDIRLKKATQKLICNCRHVTDYDIKDAVKKGRRTFFEIQKFTGAGTGCTSCLKKAKAVFEQAISASEK